MKKCERYVAAMIAVIDDPTLGAYDKLEIIETLMGEKSLAEMVEKMEEEEHE